MYYLNSSAPPRRVWSISVLVMFVASVLFPAGIALAVTVPALVMDTPVSTAIIGVAQSIPVTFISASSQANALIDLELYNEAGQRVSQQVFENQSLQTNIQNHFNFSWKPTAVGTYTLKGGVFTQGWGSLLLWENKVGTITVQNMPVVVSAPIIRSVEVWWPTKDVHLFGVQPFKAIVPGLALSDYTVSWQVDGGQLNIMGTNGDHKESLVDLTSWNWRGNGSYVLTFVATDKSGAAIAKQSVSIFINSTTSVAAVPVVPTASIVTTPVPAPASVPTIPVVTTSPVIVPSVISDVTFTIDTSKQTPISPYIYGTNFQDGMTWDGTNRNLTLARFGGNRLTTYNWENNASNAGSDWQQQNDGYLGGGDTPGEAVWARIQTAHSTQAAALVTVPMQGYVAKDKLANGDVGQTPNYLTTRFDTVVAKKNSALSLTPNKNDGVVYDDEFVNYLEKSFAYASTDANRKIFYSLDNEPDLWSGTHPRIQTQPVSYASLIDKTITTASAIKDVAPKCMVFGAVNYGYNGLTSLQNAPDANNRNFVDTFLQSMATAGQKSGKRLVDVLDTHWYPEATGGGQRITADDSGAAIADARVQAPRSLWDTTYREKSWIADSVNGPIALLPMLKQKIATDYPGTKLAVSEYYYGGGNDISGALAEADVLGIFAREGVFAANLWHLGNTDDKFIYGAMAMFRNFDNAGSTFGDINLQALTTNNTNTSIYASLDSKDSHKLILIAINKTGSSQSADIVFNGATLSTGKVYTLTAGNATPQSSGTVAVDANNHLHYNLPANSISTIVLTVK